MAHPGDTVPASRTIAVAALLLLPLAGLALLLAFPSLDARWEHQPAHFWLVLSVATLNVVLAVATGEAAARRSDARTFLVSTALLVSAGFLGLHALATPGVLLDGPNAGFTIATPVGLLLASLFAAAAARIGDDGPVMSLERQRRLRLAVLIGLGLWAAASLTELGFLARPPSQEVPAPLRVLAPVSIGLYGFAAVRTLELYRRRRRVLPLAVAVAWVLLAEAMIAIVFARSWHVTWWEWHVLMAAAYISIFLGVRAEYRREGSVAGAFTGLYQQRALSLLDTQTSEALTAISEALRTGTPIDDVRARLRAAGLSGERIAALEGSAAELNRVNDLLHGYVGARFADQLASDPELSRLGGREAEVTVLFADLVGFTTYSEVRPPEAGMELLNTYWAAVVPAIVDEYGGYVERFAGDGILVIFNTLRDQPDHARRAVRCASFIQREIGRIAEGHPDYPLFRIGINTGPAVLGNVGAAQRRAFTVIGDTANTAARFEALARPGRILLGPATRAELGDEIELTALGPTALKGKADPVEVYEVVA